MNNGLESLGSGDCSFITVVIPVLNEAHEIARTLETTQGILPGARIVVADGSSGDETVALAQRGGADVVISRRGRGNQLRAGANVVSSPWILFLHADTRLPSDAARHLTRFSQQPLANVSTFRLQFDNPDWFLKVCCWFTRFDTVFTRFGDQGIFIRRSFYDQLGGFSPWPLFEDVDLLQRARSRSKIISMPASVTTSARRFRKRGRLAQQWLNTRLLLRYLCGASPESLAARYRS